MEAHGTGTSLGDPIELDALSHVFAERGSSAPLVLGSVKTNSGHLEAAAGIAGFMKTVLSIRHAYIPKHLNFERFTPNAKRGLDLVWPSHRREWSGRRPGVRGGRGCRRSVSVGRMRMWWWSRAPLSGSAVAVPTGVGGEHVGGVG